MVGFHICVNLRGGYIMFFFPTCQVRVVRFYVSCLLLPPPASSCLLLPPASSSSSSSRCPPRPPAQLRQRDPQCQCSLPDLNHDHPRPVFPAGPQPRVSTPSVPCRTSCRKICQIECQKICQKICQIICQKICQIECQIECVR